MNLSIPATASALLGLVAGVAFGTLGARILRRAPDARAMGAIFLLIAATLLLDVAGALSRLTTGTAGTPGDALRQAAYVTAALSMVPLMYVTARRLSSRRSVALTASSLFLGLAITGVSWLYTAGFSTPLSLDTPWAVDAETSTSIVLAFIAMPALTAAGLLVFAAHGARGADARRVRLASLAASLFYTAFTMDAVGASTATVPILRFVMVGAALLGFAAFFPHEVEHRLRIRVSERTPHTE